MNKLRTLLLLGGVFLIGGGVFYLQTTTPEKEVVLYGDIEESVLVEENPER
jgi:hypothetical protein